MAISLGELELKVKANIDEVRDEIEALNGEDVSISVAVELDTSTLQTFISEQHTATVDVEANTENAENSIENITSPAEEYAADVDINEGDDNVSGAIDEIEETDYNADVDIEAGDDNVSDDISGIEDGDYSADIDIDAGTDEVSDDISDIEDGDYAADVDIYTGTDEVTDDISDIEDGDYSADVDIDTGTDEVTDDINDIETGEYSADVDIDPGDDSASGAIEDVEDGDYNAEVDVGADTSQAETDFNTFKDTIEKAKLAVKIVSTVVGVVTDPAEWADNVMTEATKWGISNQQYQVLEYMTGELDVEMSQWEIMYKNFFTQIKADAAEGADKNEAMSAMELLGINPDNFESEFDMMLGVIEALQGYSGENKEGIIAAIFGDKSKVDEIMNLLDGVGEKMNDLEERAYSSGYVKDDETLDKLGGFQDAIDSLTNAWEGLKNEIGAILAEDITAAITKIEPVLSTLTSLIKDGKLDGEDVSNLGTVVGEAFTGIVETAFAVTGTIGSALITLLTNINWEDVLGGISNVIVKALQAISDPEFLQSLGDAVSNIISGIGGFLNSPEFAAGLETLTGTVLPNLLSSIITIVPQLLETISTSVQWEPLLDTIKTAIISILDTLTDESTLTALGDIAISIINMAVDFLTSDKLTGFITTLVSKIADALPGLLSTLMDVVMKILDAIVDNMDVLLPKLVEILGKLISALSDKLPELISLIVSFIPDIISKIVELLPTILQGIVDSIDILFAVIPDLITEIIKQLPTIITAITKEIPGLITTIGENSGDIIGSLVTGLIESVPDIVSSLIETIPDLINGLFNAIKNVGLTLWDLITGNFSSDENGKVVSVENEQQMYTPEQIDLLVEQLVNTGMTETQAMETIENSLNTKVPIYINLQTVVSVDKDGNETTKTEVQAFNDKTIYDVMFAAGEWK